MAFQHGKNTYFAIGTTGAPTTPTDISAYLDNVDFPEVQETGDTTVFGKDNHTYIVGLQDGTISISGKWDPTVDAHLAGLKGEDQPLAWDHGPAGNSTGNVKYSQAGGTGNPGAILTSYEISNPVGDVVTFSAEFQISDAVTRGTF